MMMAAASGGKIPFLSIVTRENTEPTAYPDVIQELDDGSYALATNRYYYDSAGSWGPRDMGVSGVVGANWWKIWNADGTYQKSLAYIQTTSDTRFSYSWDSNVPNIMRHSDGDYVWVAMGMQSGSYSYGIWIKKWDLANNTLDGRYTWGNFGYTWDVINYGLSNPMSFLDPNDNDALYVAGKVAGLAAIWKVEETTVPYDTTSLEVRNSTLGRNGAGLVMSKDANYLYHLSRQGGTMYLQRGALPFNGNFDRNVTITFSPEPAQILIAADPLDDDSVYVCYLKFESSANSSINFMKYDMSAASPTRTFSKKITLTPYGAQITNVENVTFRADESGNVYLVGSGHQLGGIFNGDNSRYTVFASLSGSDGSVNWINTLKTDSSTYPINPPMCAINSNITDTLATSVQLYSSSLNKRYTILVNVATDGSGTSGTSFDLDATFTDFFYQSYTTYTEADQSYSDSHTVYNMTNVGETVLANQTEAQVGYGPYNLASGNTSLPTSVHYL